MKNEKEEQIKSVDGQSVEVVFPDDLKRGVYANSIFVNHTNEEVILDFLIVVPPTGSVVSRVVISPSHAKRLVRALAENIKKYEELFGAVPEEIKPKNA